MSRDAGNPIATAIDPQGPQQVPELREGVNITNMSGFPVTLFSECDMEVLRAPQKRS